MASPGRGSKVWHRLGVWRGRERRRERRKWKGWEAWGRTAESVGRALARDWVRTGREGGEGGEMLCTSRMHMIRDTGRLGCSARVSRSRGDGLVMVRAEGEAVRSAYSPIEGTEGEWDSSQ